MEQEPEGRAAILTDVEFVSGTALHREADRTSDLPILRNGPPGTFVLFPDGLRVSLPTDQIVRAEDAGGRARVGFGGMRFDGVTAGRLAFSRVRELSPDDRLSPDRSHTMTLAPKWVAAVHAGGRRVWPPAVIYKIAPSALWRASEVRGSFNGSPVDERDGFIHLSTAAQVHETAARHFTGVADLLLIAVSAYAVDLRWEPSRGGDLFPHLYGSLSMSAVRWVRALPLGAGGRHVCPRLD
jgi:uncharacterized protein (DUF952 family)